VVQQTKRRMERLVQSGVVDSEAAELTVEAIERFPDPLTESATSMVEQMTTHLVMALTRVFRGEALTEPHLSEAMWAEVASSPHREEARRQVAWLNHRCGRALPQSEQDFLYLYYVLLLQETRGKRRGSDENRDRRTGG